MVRLEFRMQSSNFQNKSSILIKISCVSMLAGLLAACSSTPRTQQQIPIAQEVATYKARARSYYAPPGPPEDPWGPYIKEASKRFDVPEQWIRSVIKQESGGSLYHNGQLVTSGPGAMGLMQLMPPTYDEMRMAYNLGDDAYDPHDNIMAGTAYVRQMYDIYGSPGFLAAYNGGPGRLDDFLTKNRTLPLETRRYVASIGPQIEGVNPKRRSQADLLVDGHRNGGGIDQTAYASAAQPGSLAGGYSSQASSVQQAWARRESGADSLNASSLNGTSTALTDTLNNQSLRSKTGRATNFASASNSGYPSRWKAVTPQRTSSSSSNDVASAWQSRGYQQTPEPPPIIAQPVQVASAPANDRNYYQPVSYQLQQSSSQTGKSFRTSNTRSASRNAVAASSSSGSWGIQVGAFNSVTQAQSAAGIAKVKAALHAGNQKVQTVTVGRNKLYRARVTGLSQEAARNACKKLASCMLLSPSNI